MSDKDRQVMVTHQPSLEQMQTMAKAIAGSKMFGVVSEDQAMALMLLCQAEGIHPVMALRRYHIIEGKPAFRADALQGEFEREGAILWHARDENECSATFWRHVSSMDTDALKRARERYKRLKAKEDVADLAMPNELTIVRTKQDAIDKGIALGWDKDKNEWKLKKNWRQSPRQMLHARCLTEGVRAVNPGLIAGIYTEEEIIDFEPQDTSDHPPHKEVIEQNVREATANAAAEAVANGGEVTQVQEREGVTTTKISNPSQVTADNYKEVLCHIGKDNGIKWKKVGELHPDVITWLKSNWVANLKPTATDEDLRLKAAITFAFDNIKQPEKAAPAAQEVPQSAGSPPPPTATLATTYAITKPAGATDVGAKQACIADLRGRIEDMVLTEPQAMEFLAKMGVSNQGWKTLDDIPESMLLYLSTPDGWGTFKKGVEAELKPKVSAAIPKKTARKKAWVKHN